MTINTTTKNLETYAKTRGMWISVRKMGDKPDVRYYIIAVDGLHLDQPRLLGKNIRESELKLEEMMPKPKPRKDMKGTLCITKGCTGRFKLDVEDSDYVRCPKCFYVMARKQEPNTMLLASIISSL